MSEPKIKIYLSCYSRSMRYNITTPNPKNYPYWKELVSLMKQKTNWELTQVKQLDEPSFDEIYLMTDFSLDKIAQKVKHEMDFFVSIDSFLPHMANYYGKVGFVIFGQSDPEIFGYKENFNILKDRRNLRKEQFWNWEQTPYRDDVFVSPEKVFEILTTYIP